MRKTFTFILVAGALTFAGCSTTGTRSKSEAGSADDGTSAALAFLDQLSGKWILSGNLAGRETTHDVDAEWVLNREYMRLHEVSRERDTNGHPAYEAIVLIGWDDRVRQYSCLWLDTTSGGGLSGSGIGHGKRSGATIPFLFISRDGSRFHNAFVYDSAAATWRWDMDDEEGGKLQPFGRVVLRRPQP